MTITVDLSALDAELQGIDAELHAAARPAAQAAAQVLYERVRANVARIKPVTGKLASSIYQAYSRDQSHDGREVYHISWNAKKAPHGHLVEFGHLERYEVSHDAKTGRFITHKDRPLATPKHIAAKPFLRPAVDAFPAAQAAGESAYLARLQERGVTKP